MLYIAGFLNGATVSITCYVRPYVCGHLWPLTHVYSFNTEQCIIKKICTLVFVISVFVINFYIRCPSRVLMTCLTLGSPDPAAHGHGPPPPAPTLLTRPTMEVSIAHTRMIQ